jgi:hypothetical protein
MEYGLEVWYETLKKFQNRGLRRILGAVGSTAVPVMHVEAGGVMPLKEKFRFLAEKRGIRGNYRNSGSNPLSKAEAPGAKLTAPADQLRSILL